MKLRDLLNEAFIDASGNLQNFQFNQNYKLPTHLVSNNWSEGDVNTDLNPIAAKEENFEWVRVFIRPGEGWDKDHLEKVAILKREDKFEVYVYVPFGEYVVPKNELIFNTEKEAFEEAIRIMEELIEN